MEYALTLQNGVLKLLEQAQLSVKTNESLNAYDPIDQSYIHQGEQLTVLTTFNLNANKINPKPPVLDHVGVWLCNLKFNASAMQQVVPSVNSERKNAPFNKANLAKIAKYKS